VFCSCFGRFCPEIFALRFCSRVGHFLLLSCSFHRWDFCSGSISPPEPIFLSFFATGPSFSRTLGLFSAQFCFSCRWSARPDLSLVHCVSPLGLRPTHIRFAPTGSCLLIAFPLRFFSVQRAVGFLHSVSQQDSSQVGLDFLFAAPRSSLILSCHRCQHPIYFPIRLSSLPWSPVLA
jgi:hypothetical protein